MPVIVVPHSLVSSHVTIENNQCRLNLNKEPAEWLREHGVQYEVNFVPGSYSFVDIPNVNHALMFKLRWC